MTRRKILPFLLFAFCFEQTGTRSTHAQVLWDAGTGNNFWNVAANWSPNNVPTPSDSILFNDAFVSSAQIIDLKSDRTVNGVLGFSGAVSFTLENFTLTLGNTLTNNASATMTLNSGVVLSGNRTMQMDGSGDFIVNGVISGAFALTKTGSGLLTLNADNTFSGGFTLSAGTLQLGHDGAVGTGTLTIDGGTILASGGSRILDEAVTVGGNFTVSGSNALTLSGNMNLGSSSRTFTVSNSAMTTFSGAISGSADFIKAGSGSLTISGAAANTFSGTTYINEGTLILSKSGGATAIAGNITIGDGSGGIAADILQLTAADQIADTSAITIQSSGRLDLNGNNETIASIAASSSDARLALGSGTLTLGDSTSTTFAGEISGTGSLVKQGTGTLTLTGNNTFTGALQVNNGVLNLQHANATGTTANGVTVASGAALELQGGIAVGAEALNLSGSGISSAGALRNISGANSWAGNITLSGATRIASDAGTLTVSGGISGSGHNLTVSGAGNTTLSGAITTGTGALTKEGTGTLTLSGNNTYTGATTISAGTLAWGADDRISDSSAVAVNGGTLQLSGTFSDRVGDLSYNNGTLNFGTTGTANYFLINGGGAASGTLNVLNWQEGIDRFAFVSANSNSLSTAFLDGIYFSGFGAGATTSDPDQTIGSYGSIWTFLLPRSSFVTWDGGHPSQNGWTFGQNWVGDVAPTSGNTAKVAFDGSTRLTPDLNTDFTLNALKFASGAGSFSLTSSSSRTLTFDGILPSLIHESANQQTIGHAVALNATTIFDLAAAGSLTVSGVISGSGGVEKIGNASLILSGNNTFSGETTVSVGALNLQHGNALGSTSAGTTVASGAALELQGGIAIGAEALTLNNSGVSSSGAMRNISGNNSWSGSLTLASATRINSDAGTLTLSGAISGSGMGLTIGGAGNVTLSGVLGTGSGTLTKDGAGTLTLSGSSANTFTGETLVNAGTLVLGKTAGIDALAGQLTIGDGAGGAGADIVQLGAANQIGNSAAVTISSSGRLDLNSFDETIGSLAASSSSSQIVLGSGILTIGDSSSTTFAGVISGSGSIVKQGTGTLTLSGANTFSGATTVNSGVLHVQNANALGTTAAGVTVSSGAALQLQGGISVGSESLTLNGSGISSGGSLRNISGDNSWSGNVTLGSAARIHSDAGTLTLTDITGAAQNLTIGGAGNVTIDGVISTTTGAVAKEGAGTLTLNANNTFSGGVSLSAGTISAGHDNAFGSGALTLSGGTLLASGGSRNISNNATIDGDVTIGGTDALTFSGAWTHTGGNRTLTISNEAATTISGGVALAENNQARTLTLNVGAGGLTVSGVISDGAGSGADGLTKTGSGTLTLSGNNTYTGATTISAGTLALSASERISDSSALDLSGGTLDLATFTERVNNLSFNNGTLDFGTTGAANYFMFNDDGNSPSSPLIVYNWEDGVDRFAFQSVNTMSSAFLENIYFAGFGAVATTSAANQTIPGYGSIWTFLLPTEQFYDTWDGGHASQNKWTVNANWDDNSSPIGGLTTRVAFDGSTRLTPDMDLDFTVNSLRFNTNASSFTLSSLDERTLTFDGILPSLMQRSANNQTINNKIALNATTFVDTTGAGTLTLGGVVSGSGGLTKVGSSTLILTGANTFSGAVTLNAGVINIRNTSALGSTAAGTTVASGAALELQGTIAVGSESLSLNGAGISSAGALRNVSDNNSWSGNITLGSATRINSDSGTLTLSGNISGSGQNLTVGGAGNVSLSGVIGTTSGTLTKDGAGILTLSGNNTFTGDLTLSAGTLRLSSSNERIADTVAVHISSGATFDLNNLTETIGSLGVTGGAITTGTGSLVLGGDVTGNASASAATLSGNLNLNGARIFTIADGAAANDMDISAVISNGTLTKAGAGVLNLSANNTFTGGLNINAGTVQLGASERLADSLAVSLSSGATLNLNNFNETIGSLSMTAGTVSSGSGALILGGNVTGNAAAAAATISGNLDLGGATRTFTIADGAAASDMNVSAVISNGALTKSGAGTLTLSAANTYSGATTVSAGVLNLQNASALGATAAGSTVQSGASLQISGGLAIGSEALTLNGSGIANDGALRSVSGNNSWAGAITLGAASLVYADADSLSLSGAIDNSSHTLSIGGAGNVTATGVISGSGGLTKNDGGTLTLSGTSANTFSGATTVNAGTVLLNKTAGLNAIAGNLTIGDGSGGAGADMVQLSAANQIANGAAVTINASGRLDLNGQNETIGSLAASSSTAQVTLGSGTLTLGDANSTLFAGVISGSGAIEKQGAGTITLTGANTFTGVTTINAGAVNLQNADALGSTVAGAIVNSGGALQLQGAVAIGVEALTLNGSGVSNDGALRNVSGNNSWAGAVTLGSAATIASDADTLSLNGAIDNNGHALTVAGAGNTTVGAAISGTGGLTKEGAGTLTLNAASSFAGNITIIEGTLLLGASDRIGDSTNMDLNGGTFATGGYDETLGTLTLSANSYIDLGDADSVLSFANSSAISWTPDTVLIVRNWNGSGYGGGSDQLYFGNALTGLTAGQLAQIRFENPNGVSGLFVAGILPTGEVVPIPEPWPAAIVALLAAIVAWKERRQIARFWMTCTSSIAQVRGAMK